MKSLKHTANDIATYCSARIVKAKTHKAELWWINRHYEATCPERYREVRECR